MKREFHPQILIVSFTLICCLCLAAVAQPAVSRQYRAPVHILGSDGFMRDWLIVGMFPNPRNKLESSNRYLQRGQSCLYWVTLPKGYDKQRAWPMIIYLHASNLQGHDLSRIGTPIPPDVDQIKSDFPFVVLTPQCPEEYDAWPSDIVIDLVDEMVKQYNVDARRVYVTGFSLGGRGTWSVAVDHPEVFAAIVPVAGSYGHPERIGRIKDLPVWAFHGDKDGLVMFGPVRDMVQNLKDSGGNVRFTIYEGAGHGIRGRAYRTRELYEWLLKQRRQ